MEKILYPVWMHHTDNSETFSSRLRGPLADAILASGVHALQVNVADEAVAPAATLRQSNSQHPMQGMVSIWINSARERGAVESLLKQHVHRFAGYLVCESEPIRNTTRRAPAGERTPGWSQVVTLQRPPRLTHEAWLDYWLQHHTIVGIETQANFRYTQNVVVRRLTLDAPVVDAIIEECFPTEAMTSQHAFYDAAGDDEKLRKHFTTMMESCGRFIDPDKLDVVPTSEYIFRHPLG